MRAFGTGGVSGRRGSDFLKEGGARTGLKRKDSPALSSADRIGLATVPRPQPALRGHVPDLLSVEPRGQLPSNSESRAPPLRVLIP